MSNKEKLQLELECLLKYSKEEMIEKYIDEFEENAKLSDLWCKSQQENKQLKEDKKKAREYINKRMIHEGEYYFRKAKHFRNTEFGKDLLQLLGDEKNE